MPLLPPVRPQSAAVVTWGHERLGVGVVVPEDGPVRLLPLRDAPLDDADVASATTTSGEPLVEVLVAGEGRIRAGGQGVESRVGSRLRLVGHEGTVTDGVHALALRLADPATGLTVTAQLTSPDGVPAVRAQVAVTNDGAEDVVLHAVTSLVLGGLATGALEGAELLLARNDWLGESRWERHPVRTLLPDLGDDGQGHHPKGGFRIGDVGTWSSGSFLPMGAVTAVDGRAWLWQVEHDGSWLWELGERRGGAYVAAWGPTDGHHQWRHVLAPGRSFTTVPVTVAVSSGGLDGPRGAAAALTAHRRATRRAHPDALALPVVFNDYMNTLNGDPTTQKLLPLVAAAGEVGAEVFVIDAGWYDETGDWWDSVGEWLPSTTRFPGGIGEVLDAIRAAGMVPGLWLEPEVVGVRSPLARTLPDEAFFCRAGRRHVEHDRYHLDLRHPAVRAHLDAVVDRLVHELGVGYLKLDYNVNPGPGTDVDADSAGDGLLRHNRAHLAWLDGVLDRHPDLVLENCSSGGMRSDHALMSRLQLQSTSDQQDPVRYAAIAAAAPMTLLPEQSASWAYPQPDMDPETAAFTLLTGMLGRLYLSGHLDRTAPEQRALVAHAVRVHQDLRQGIARSVPAWPLGLPGWGDPWVSLALVAPEGGTLVGLWRRPGRPSTVVAADDAGVVLELPHLAGRSVTVQTLFPLALPPWDTTWDPASGRLGVAAAGSVPAARLLRVTAAAGTTGG